MPNAKLNARQPERKRKRGERNLKRLTDDNVLKLPVKRWRQYMAWDAGSDAARGLGVLISPTGTRSYRVVYYFPGDSKPHSMHLGRVGEMTLAEARDRALAARKKSREGIDPKGDDLTKSADFKVRSRITSDIGSSETVATQRRWNVGACC